MTIQAMCFLRKLRKAQRTENREVFLNFMNMKAITAHDGSEPYETVELEEFRDSAMPLLRYLEGLGYIQHNGHGTIRVLHAGWHTTQIAVGKLISFLAQSVLIPIVVSIITTLIIGLLGQQAS